MTRPEQEASELEHVRDFCEAHNISLRNPPTSTGKFPDVKCILTDGTTVYVEVTKVVDSPSLEAWNYCHTTLRKLICNKLKKESINVHIRFTCTKTILELLKDKKYRKLFVSNVLNAASEFQRSGKSTWNPNHEEQGTLPYLLSIPNLTFTQQNHPGVVIGMRMFSYLNVHELQEAVRKAIKEKQKKVPDYRGNITNNSQLWLLVVLSRDDLRPSNNLIPDNLATDFDKVFIYSEFHKQSLLWTSEIASQGGSTK